ncbi:hypothetical protein HRI_001075100 [Hibiscus trionum]|uniref:DUF4283 domain-containing protein n=1 Tax=Hibiscus trionum TaxID=183268 RepID=A0A9W7LRF5_HIBTR|nr:hypothetical protein HRI_001075100 [Hibiscus trionum]
MRHAVIVRVLGRNIGYQTLLNRIHALWHPWGELQVIDLDNNYFLVRLDDPKDYEKVLTERPWTIYDSYLRELRIGGSKLKQSRKMLNTVWQFKNHLRPRQ